MPADPRPAPPPGTRPRTAARVAAVQALFQQEQTAEPPEFVIDQFRRHRMPPPSATSLQDAYEAGLAPLADVALFERIVREACRETPQIDLALSALLPADWPLHRLDPVLRSLLRCAMAELGRQGGVPARIVISEYLDIAHGFFIGAEPGLANGILDRAARTLRAAEFGEA